MRTSDLQDYDCIVFVEGPNDRKIFGKWAKKIVPTTSILLVPSEGWTNMDYFANASIVDELDKPLFVIFDGDTDREHVRSIKAKLVTRLKLDPRSIITLKGRSIEDYLLNTRSMKAAFPEIQLKESEIRASLQSSRRKQNKKTVLDLFFKRYVGRKYDGETGERIAAHMTLGEIDSEIVDIFTRIGEVAKADQGLTSKSKGRGTQKFEVEKPITERK